MSETKTFVASADVDFAFVRMADFAEDEYWLADQLEANWLHGDDGPDLEPGDVVRRVVEYDPDRRTVLDVQEAE